MISTEGDHVESVVSPLDGLEEGGEGVPRDVGVEVEGVAGPGVLGEHVVHRPGQRVHRGPDNIAHRIRPRLLFRASGGSPTSSHCNKDTQISAVYLVTSGRLLTAGVSTLNQPRRSLSIRMDSVWLRPEPPHWPGSVMLVRVRSASAASSASSSTQRSERPAWPASLT